MDTLRIGIIGLGMGRNHIDGYRRHTAALVTAIADPDGKRLKEVGDSFGIDQRYESAERMFENEHLDIVSIATPNVFHKDLTLAAFEHGCHVLCEKPMAMNAAEGREMLDAAERAGKRLMINFSFRFNPQSAALKKEVDAGTLGDIYFGRTVWHRRRGIPALGSWFGQKKLSGGGPLIDLGVHRLDLALWLMGYPQPEWVIGNTYSPIAARLASEQNLDFDVEDFAAGLVKFKNGAMLEVEASWAANLKETDLMSTRLLGSKGGLVQKNLDDGFLFDAEIFVERNGSQFNLRLSSVGSAPMSAMEHFVDCILEDKPHIAGGEEGLVVMKLLDAIYESAATGGPVRING